MKQRNGFVSNSSSSSFCIKKTDIDHDELKRFLEVYAECYTLVNDDPEDSKEQQDTTEEYYLLRTESYTDTYLEDHFKLLEFLNKRKIKDYVDKVRYRGDGRPDKKEEKQALKLGYFPDEV